MDTASVACAPTPDTPAMARALQERADRGLALFRHHRHEIEDLGSDLYLVPSASGENFYGVNYATETCSCPDAARHPELVCKHVFAIGVLNGKRRARRGVCSGCGTRVPLRAMVEAFEGDGTTQDAGERFCRPCAVSNGVLY